MKKAKTKRVNWKACAVRGIQQGDMSNGKALAASKLDDVSIGLGDFDEDFVEDLTVDMRSPRLARGTEPLQEAVDPHIGCSVALHESLSSLLELEALVTRLGGYLTTEQQESVWRARALLTRWGRR